MIDCVMHFKRSRAEHRSIENEEGGVDKTMEQIQQLLKKYDLKRMVEVLEDRVINYYDYCAELEEPHLNADGNYRYAYGYGQTLKHALELVKQLKQLKDDMQSNRK